MAKESQRQYTSAVERAEMALWGDGTNGRLSS
jgi:hypothetical protein